MFDAPLALAFTAGLVATVNPCGFAMLPAYLSYFMGLEDDATVSRPAAVGRALTIGAAVSAGLLLVFVVVGVVITLGFRSVIGVIPWAALFVGAGIGVLGVAMLAGFKPTARLPVPQQAASGRGYGSVFLFGSSYAVASLSCTLPVFLIVVTRAATATSFASGLVAFLAYGLGMSLLLVVITVALGLGKRSLLTRLRRSGRYLDRVAGAVLVLAGGYVVWYWVVNLSSGVAGQSAPTGFVETLSARATGVIGQHAELLGLGLAAVVFAAVAYTVLRRGEAGRGDADHVDRGEADPVGTGEVGHAAGGETGHADGRASGQPGPGPDAGADVGVSTDSRRE